MFSFLPKEPQASVIYDGVEVPSHAERRIKKLEARLSFFDCPELARYYTSLISEIKAELKQLRGGQA